MLMMESCLVHLMENCSGKLMDLLMETSLACLLAGWIVMQKVQQMDDGSV